MHLENVEFHAVDMYFVGGGGGVQLKKKLMGVQKMV